MQMYRKNILIFTTINDKSSDGIIDWLLSIEPKILIYRINDTDDIKISISNDNVLILHKEKEIKVDSSLIIYYRRGNLFSHYSYNNIVLNNIIQNEVMRFKEFFFTILESTCFVLGSYLQEVIYKNKLLQNYYAKGVGLNTASYYLTNYLDDKIAENVIIKSIADVHPFEHENYRYAIQYKFFSNAKLHSKNISFYQDYIPKSFEIRSFFLDKEFYSMATFTQDNQNSAIDGRNDPLNINKKTPYVLPPDIKAKLLKVADKIGINTGSFDLLFNEAMGYIFLEVNPSGQFEWVSKNCNYYLEEKIALYLYGKISGY